MNSSTITELSSRSALEEVVQLLSCASARALALSSARHDLAMGALGLGAQLAVSQALGLLPADVDVDESVPGHATPIDLVRSAEAVTRTVPIEQFPPGTSQLIVAICDLIREHG
ncbi:hypothetical protein LL946_10545 [Knoellia locipacati]|uniref:hypothetical protein n=1 Tax=Knoellia locipacati TaxID=882824 RepID=UPI00384E6AA0